MPHEHFKIDFTPKLISQENAKYGNNLMSFELKLKNEIF